MIRLLVIFFVSYFVIRFLARSLAFFPQSNSRQKKPSPKKTPALNTEPLTSCPHCQTYFQASRGVIQNGQIFCSVNCTDLPK